MICPSQALSSQIIDQQLENCPGWLLKDNALERVYVGKSYLDALEKLNQIAQLSEAANHHPDLTLSWKTLTVRFWTHTAQGITHLDFELARQAESVLNDLPHG